ncbi:MAG: hypothetical protein PCFJNLEI_00406 [Verrucomicrobiae bacterium]|nr:hypothetical protein [Verrucomicrobiae bacterium]
MSLVYEALQKAEREKNRKSPPPPAPVVPAKEPPRPVAAPPAQRSYLPLVIVCVSLVAIVSIVLIAAWHFSEKRTEPAVVAGEPRSAASESKPADIPAQLPPPAPATSTANDPRFKLTGITGNQDIGYGAIINGRLLRDGQYVDGAIVQKIERDRVLLNLDGREIVVRLF